MLELLSLRMSAALGRAEPRSLPGSGKAVVYCIPIAGVRVGSLKRGG